MQALKAIARSIGLLFLLGVLLLLFYITRTLLLAPKQDQLNYIPEQADWVVRLNSRNILDKTFQSVFIEGTDRKLVNDLYRKLIKSKKTGEKPADVGIDFLSDIVVFKMPYKSSYVLGILVKLTNEDAFEQSIGSTVSAQEVAITHNEVGLILNYFGEEKKHEDAIELQQLADNILSNSMAKLKAPNRDNALLSIFGKNNDLSLTIEKNALVFNGTFTPKTRLIHSRLKQLKEKGFRIDVAHISEFTKLLPYTPIDVVNFNFLGYGQNTKNGTPAIKFELLVRFTTKTDIIALLKDKYKMEIGLNETGNQISILNQDFFYEKLDEQTVYIGSTAKPEFVNKAPTKLFRINGNPSTLFAYNSSSWAMKFLELYPEFYATKQLALKTKAIGINMVVKNNKQVQVSGKITLKEGLNPMSEILRFLLTANILL